MSRGCKLRNGGRGHEQDFAEGLTSEEAELKAAIEKIFAEIEREHEQMKRDQEEIERSRARTREMLARLKAA